MPARKQTDRQTSALCSLVAYGGVHEGAARPGVLAFVALFHKPRARHGAKKSLIRFLLLEDPAQIIQK